jgi:hypothetical protein
MRPYSTQRARVSSWIPRRAAASAHEHAAARGDYEGAVNSWRPDYFAFDEALDMFEDRIAVVAGFRQFGVSLRAEQHGIRAADADQAQLAESLGKGFRVLANIFREGFFGIAGALPDANDSGRVVAFENRTVFGEGEFARGVFGGLPVRIIGAAFHIINHLSLEIEWYTQLDERLGLALAGVHTFSGRRDCTQVASPDG